ncbi:gluconate 2-dehydrogenase subunit 3 family protein [Paenibacillus sp. VMFN-D1]|uniref:gluconate 2-dehydrogenase subunit 3 family protein n=1 Tax=Paenibacillus sp. VMFN-D1 TaxID=2135608 RepID=UPI000E2282BF|nr:gluconate 2-dehydrogenase subunit 3 family protein [Paenibacillus sp. VMFN-D1]MCM2999515.1 gluconate 2-dehydrogenase subunit 3 family protein [Paenibacillus cellulositrophicus]RED39288.1 gluconate 2-dehydrogenase gamma chain [Paenibacillus sp. VMFN-D1]
MLPGLKLGKSSKPARSKEPDESRRKFLKASGMTLGGLVVGGVFGGVLTDSLEKNQAPKTAPADSKPEASLQDALMFFNQEQFKMTEAAAERIYPEDENGPGAKALGVAFFIDHQLAGPWGYNARDYMMGPFVQAQTTQGEQSRLKRNEMFTLGLEGLKSYCQQKHQKAFTELEGQQQDEVLTAMEKGDKFPMRGVTSSSFFNMLKNLTIEGVYADPLYGGNRNMNGWKMRNFPGNQMSYAQQITKEGLVQIQPKSLQAHMSE